ncbi:Uncharacterised protein [Porphyromonas macacae]|uniref:Uncharacterized protein n=1 Tax=Porphyromonas macacae TaxID=28115 RepID=A0A379E8H2_9PORP|nr:Uncharacterised protein [Porphyromonas macacae]
MSGDIPFVSLTRITHEHNYQEKKPFFTYSLLIKLLKSYRITIFVTITLNHKYFQKKDHPNRDARR